MSNPGRWRIAADEVVRATLAALPQGATEKEARRALCAAYPFGERSRHPYKVWCHVVRWSLAKRFPSGTSSYRIFNREESKRGLAPMPESVVKTLFSEAGL